MSVLAVFLAVFLIFKDKGKEEAFSEDVKPQVNYSKKNTPDPKPEFLREHPDSIPKMAKKEYSGENLKLFKVLDNNNAYTRHSITYQSEGFTISGIMNIPKGEGPFPILILNHGYIDPEVYTNGQGLKREQDFFARHGYAVLHSDYRNHAYSDFDPNNEIRPRAGYVEDVINATRALKKSDLEMIDRSKIGMLGHSMGGGVTLNVMVIKPEIAQAYALLAPIHSDYKVNFNKWVVSDWSQTAKEFVDLYGKPEENPELWDTLSAKNYFNRVSSPIILHQGEADNQVPVAWSQELSKMLKSARKDIRYFEYPEEGHTFYSAQSMVMQRTLDFFNEHLN